MASLAALGMIAFFLALSNGEAHAQSATLTWSDNSTNEDGFRCERSTNGGPFAQVCDVGPDVTTWQDANILFNVQYCYKVSAHNSAGVSAPSNEACITLTQASPNVTLQLSCAQIPDPPSSVLASDTFTRANSADLGANWTVITGELTWSIAGNTAIPSTLASDHSERYSGRSWPNNQYAQVRVLTTSGGGAGSDEGVGILLRGSATAKTYYRIIINAGSTTNNVGISKKIAGVYTNLGFRSQPFATNGVLYAEIVGSTIKVKWNGVQLGATIIDTSITTGSPGVTYSSTLSAASLDDWEGGGLP